METVLTLGMNEAGPVHDDLFQEVDDAEARQLERARWRAKAGHVVGTAFTAAAVAVALRRGRKIGFRKLFNSVSAPKDFVYIGFLYGLGDVSQQLVTKTRQQFSLPKDKREWDMAVDWKGVGTVSLVGCTLFGPVNHYWYTFLDKWFRGTSFKTVVKKVVVDQLSLPIPICIFFVAMSLMRAKPDLLEELKAKGLQTYLMGSILWPSTQFFNFRFVPLSSRVLFIGGIELVWTNVLCFMKDMDIEGGEPLEALD